MAARNFAPVRALVREAIPIIGSFAPNGVSAVAASSRKGLGFTVARTGVGAFRLTFTDKYADLVSATASVQLSALADTDVVIGPFSQANKTLDLLVKTAGVAADIAANANNRINFVAWFRNTSMVPVRGA